MKKILLLLPLLFLLACNDKPKINSKKYLNAWVDTINTTPLYPENRKEYNVNLLSVKPQKSSITSRGQVNRSDVALYITKDSAMIQTEIYTVNRYEPIEYQIADVVQQQKSKARYDTFLNQRWRLYIDQNSSMKQVKPLLEKLYYSGIKEICFMAASNETFTEASIPDKDLYDRLISVHENSSYANRVSKIADLLRPVVLSEKKFQQIFDQTSNAVPTYRDSTYLVELVRACIGTDQEKVKKMLTLSHYFMCYEREPLDVRIVTFKESGHNFEDDLLWKDAGTKIFESSATSVWF